MEMAETKQWVVREVSSATMGIQYGQLTALEAYLDIQCGLGEAPFYEEASHSLRFVDINKKKMHVVDLNQGPSSLQTFDLDVAVRLDWTVQK